jgi:hypothetical protein
MRARPLVLVAGLTLISSSGAPPPLAAPAVALVPAKKVKPAVALTRVPDYACPFAEPGGEEPCDGSDLQPLTSRQVGIFGQVTIDVIRQAGGSANQPDRCQEQKILLFSRQADKTVYWTLDVPGNQSVTWDVRRLAAVRAGKDHLLWLELEGTGAGRDVFVFGLARGGMARLVSGLPLVRVQEDGTEAQINVDFPSPASMHVAARTAAVTDEQKKWLGSRPLSAGAGSEGRPVEMRVDYPDVDVCSSGRTSNNDTHVFVDSPTETADFGKVSVHVVAQGPQDFMYTEWIFVVSEGPKGGSLIPVDELVSSHSNKEGLEVRRLEEIRPGGRPLLWLEADVCRQELIGADATVACDRRGYLLDRTAKGLLRYRAYGVPLIDDPGKKVVHDEKKDTDVEKSLGPKTILDVQFPDAHTLTASAKTPTVSKEQKKWLGAHALP